MKSPKFSIIIPSFNKAKYLSNTLSSIFQQNYENVEVIIQDGGSTDGSVDIIKKFSIKFPGIIKWESKIDKGQLDAVNKGLSKSTGDILSFINADDCYEENTFSLVSKAAIKNPHALWFAGKGIAVNENNKQILLAVTWYKNLLLKLNSYFILLTVNYLMQPSVFFTRTAYDKYGSFTGTNDFIMEYDFWLKTGKHQMPIVLPSVLTRFHMGADTITSNRYNDILGEDRRILMKHTKNPIIILIHDINNIGRKIINLFL